MAAKQKVELQTITPGRALQMLNRNTKNRKPSTKRVKELGGEMIRGAWVISNDIITFDENGDLTNGQHRLLAVVDSGVTIQCFVGYGIPGEAQLVMDRVKGRTLADQLQMRGETNYTTLSGALSHLFRWENGTPRHSTLRPTPRQGLELLDRHPNLRLSVPFGREANSAIRFNPSLATFLHYTFALLDTESADDFFNRVASGENLHRHHPIFTLRKALVENATSTKRLPTTTIHAYVIKAWNAYIKGEELRLLRFRAGGANPEPFPEAIAP